ALTASDLVLMPLQAEFLPLKGLQSFMVSLQLIQKQLNPDLEVLGYLLTKFDSRKKMHQQVSQQLKELYQHKVFNSFIRMNIALAQAQEQGMDIFHFARKSNGAMDYTSFGKELLDRLSNHHEK
ncbi:MAG: ParA family protein, partial [Cyclobacteriaceae bacterium]|nr:ParA family protein [Cyclobacteriaceae bacterium]